MRKIHWPIAILSVILVIVGEIVFLFPGLQGSGPDLGAVWLGNLEYQSDYSRLISPSNFNDIQLKNGDDLGSGTVISWLGVAETIREDNYIRYTYPIHIGYTRLTGKFAVLSDIPVNGDKTNNIIHVKIIGDRETIVYKNDWDLQKTEEILIDEPIEKIRELRIELRNSEKIYVPELQIAMLDFAVSGESGPLPVTGEQKEAINQALTGTWGGIVSKSGSVYDEILLDICSVQDGMIRGATVTLTQDDQRTGVFAASGTVSYETRTVNLFPDKWIEGPNLEGINKDAYADWYDYFPILVQLNDDQNILRNSDNGLLAKKLVQEGRK